VMAMTGNRHKSPYLSLFAPLLPRLPGSWRNVGKQQSLVLRQVAPGWAAWEWEKALHDMPNEQGRAGGV
jgi:hypothetical protein